MLISAALDFQFCQVQDMIYIFVTRFKIRISHVQLYNVAVLEKVLLLDFKYISFEMPLTDCFYGTNLFKVEMEQGFFPNSLQALWKLLYGTGCIEGD